MGHGNAAVAAVGLQDGLYALELTVLLLAFQQVKHPFYQVIDVQQLQLGAAVVDGEELVIGDCPAEGTDGTVVLGAAVAHQVHKAIDSHLCAGFLGVVEE